MRASTCLCLVLTLGACAGAPRPRPTSHPTSSTQPNRSGPTSGDLYQLDGVGTLPSRAGGIRSLERGEVIWSLDGARLDRAQLAAKLRDYDVILVGEVHASRAHQDWQARIIEALAAAKDRPLAVGLEMLPRQVQPILDKRASFADERSFLLHTGWYRHWGYDYRYYRPIFRTTAAHALPLVALNGPRKLNRAVARFGLAKLPPRLRALLPPMRVPSPDHRRVFLKMLRRSAGKHGRGAARSKKTPNKPHPRHGHGKRKPAGHPTTRPGVAHHGAGHHGAGAHGTWLDRYFAAQVLWDATMADSALRYLRRAPRARLVLLAGAGHIIYGVGIRRQLLARRPELKVLTVMPLRVPPLKSPGHGIRPAQLVSSAVADVLIGVSPPTASDRHPTLGVKLERKEGALQVVGLPGKETPARRAGVRVGDRLLAVDGEAVKTVFDVRWSLVDKRRGSRLTLRLERAGEARTLSLTLK